MMSFLQPFCVHSSWPELAWDVFDSIEPRAVLGLLSNSEKCHSFEFCQMPRPGSQANLHSNPVQVGEYWRMFGDARLRQHHRQRGTWRHQWKRQFKDTAFSSFTAAASAHPRTSGKSEHRGQLLFIGFKQHICRPCAGPGARVGWDTLCVFVCVLCELGMVALLCEHVAYVGFECSKCSCRSCCCGSLVGC